MSEAILLHIAGGAVRIRSLEDHCERDRALPWQALRGSRFAEPQPRLTSPPTFWRCPLSLSVLDLFSIGIWPSFSYTVGSIRAATTFSASLCKKRILVGVTRPR
ncbi:serine dehydratase beta chain [Arthrobacter tecti]